MFERKSVISNYNPLVSAKNTIKNDDLKSRMIRYAEKNRKLFNPSQLIVLDSVIEMPENDILLIQGPVSKSIQIKTYFYKAGYWKNALYHRHNINASELRSKKNIGMRSF